MYLNRLGLNFYLITANPQNIQNLTVNRQSYQAIETLTRDFNAKSRNKQVKCPYNFISKKARARDDVLKQLRIGLVKKELNHNTFCCPPKIFA